MFLLPDGLTPVLENTVAVERGLCGKCIVESTHLNPLANYSVGVGEETCGTILMFLSDGGPTDNYKSSWKTLITGTKYKGPG